MKTFIAPILISLLVQACTLYPRYERPALDMPDHWRISGDEASSFANCDWWQEFDDPVLSCLIQEALENNLDLQVAIVRVNQFFGNLLIASSQLYPQISGSALALRQEASLALTPLPESLVRTSNEYLCLFNAAYDLDLWGEIRSGGEAALAELMGSVDARRTVVLTLVTGVATAYIQLRQFDKQLVISQETLRSRTESYELAYARYQGGLTSELEVKQAESEMEDAAAELIRLQISVEQQENLLSVLIGHSPQSITRGLDLFEFPAFPEIPAGLPAEIIDQRPDILQAEQELIAKNALIGVAKAQFFPNITLTGFYGNASQELHNLFTAPARTWEYAAQLLQPIFTGGLLTGQLIFAEAQKWEAYYAYQQTVLEALKEVNDALVANEKTKQLLIVQRKIVAALNAALQLAKLQYQNGQVDYLNVLDAERHLFTSELELAQVQSDLLISVINIYKALGGGWVIEADSPETPGETLFQ